MFQSTSDIIGTPDANETWSRISRQLNDTTSYLRESQDQLEDRDLLFLLGMLSRVAELPITGNQSRAMAYTVIHSAIELADMLMSENIMDKEVKPWKRMLLKSTAKDTMTGWRVST